MFVIFDLDNTLVDSNALKPARDRRDWREVRARLQEVRAFEGIPQAWARLQGHGVYIAVVTHSPAWYARSILEMLGLKHDSLVAYGQIRQLKPSPEGYKQALSGYNQDANGLVVGDDVKDLAAADALGYPAVCAGWCDRPTLTREQCAERGWLWADHPTEIVDHLAKGQGNGRLDRAQR